MSTPRFIILIRMILLTVSVVAFSSGTQAQTYYWDNDGATPGFGVAAGIWAAPTVGDGTQGWSTSATGIVVPTNITTTTGNAVNFGTATDGLGAGTITVSGTVSSGSMTFGSASGTITLTGGTINWGGLASTITVNNASNVINSNMTGAGSLLINLASGDLTLGGGIGGSSATAMTKSGNGTLTLGMNTGSDVDNSFLVLNVTGGVALLNKGIVAGVRTVAGISGVSVGATVRLTGSGGDQIFSNADTWSGVNGLNGTLDLNGKGESLSNFNGGVTGVVDGRVGSGTGSATFQVGESNVSSTFNGVIRNTNGTLNFVKTGSGTQTLTGANTYAGNTTINGGVVAVTTLANGGVPSGIGQSSNVAGNLILGFNGGTPTAGTLRYTGSADVTIDRAFTLNSPAGSGIESSGTGTLSFTATGPALGYGSGNQVRTLTLGGTNTGQNTLGKLLANNGSGLTSFVKAGAGTWVLTAANTYTGTTAVNAGKLIINGNQSSASGIVTVANGATLGGTGTVGGATTVNSGGFIEPGNDSRGRLTINAATTVNTGAITSFELSAAGGTASSGTGGSSPGGSHTDHDVLAVNGALALNSSTINISSIGTTGLVNANEYSYLIATASGGITGTPVIGTPVIGADFLAYQADGGTFSLTVSGNNLYLNLTPVPEPTTTFALGFGLLIVASRFRRLRHNRATS